MRHTARRRGWNQLRRCDHQAHCSPQGPARDAELHQRLIDVIASRDESAIAAEIRDHIGQSADQVVELIGSAGTKRKAARRRRSK